MGSMKQIDRGWVGRRERPPTLESETYAAFCEGVRGHVFGPMNKPIKAATDAAIAKAKAAGRDLDRVNDVRALFDPLPVVAARNRMMRSAQEMMWRRYREEYNPAATQDYAAVLDAYDKKGPGKVEWDPDFKYPEYVMKPIHIQPGGYGGDPLAGFWYHQASNTFFMGHNDQDEFHLGLAAATRPPADGKVKRAIELGCSIGQLTVGLKERFKDAEVIGLDVASAQVRYAHKRAVDLGVDCTFVQRLAEDTKYPDSHFDIIAAFLLFHEVTLEAGEQIVKEAFRILRPGGVFNVFDFPTGKNPLEPSFRYFMEIDSKDNCEPYEVDFLTSDFAGLLTKHGFKVEYGSQEVMLARTYYAIKP